MLHRVGAAMTGGPSPSLGIATQESAPGSAVSRNSGYRRSKRYDSGRRSRPLSQAEGRVLDGPQALRIPSSLPRCRNVATPNRENDHWRSGRLAGGWPPRRSRLGRAAGSRRRLSGKRRTMRQRQPAWVFEMLYRLQQNGGRQATMQLLSGLQTVRQVLRLLQQSVRRWDLRPLCVVRLSVLLTLLTTW